MRKCSVFGLILLCLALAVPSARAQSNQAQTSQQMLDEKDSFRDYISPYIGLDGGGTLFGAADVGSALRGLDPGTPKVYGLAIGFWGRGMLSGELDFAYHKNFFGPENQTIFTTPEGGVLGSNNLMTLTASVVINPSIDAGAVRFRPYVFLGGGLMRSSIAGFRTLGRDKNNRGIVDIGGGLQFYPHKRIGLRADFRYNIGVGANDSEDGWGWMDTWKFYRIVIGPSFTF